MIRRERLSDRVPLVHPRVDFESARFNREVFVASPSRKFAYAVVHPRMMEFLLGAPPVPTIDLRNGWVCITDGLRRWRPIEFTQRVSWLEKFFALWPDYLMDALA
jgi:hypothetical protein